MIQTRYYSKKFFLRKVDERNFHPIMIMKINGISVRMLIDTGAGTTTIGKQFIEELKLIISSKASIHTIGVGSSKESSPRVEIAKFEIRQNFTLLNYKLYTFDLDYINDYYRLHNKPVIHGIIGSDLLKKFKSKIDYGERIIEFQKLESI